MTQTSLNVGICAERNRGNAMPIETLDHYSVRTADVERSRSFYQDVIGLKVGPRPNFSFPGAWLYAGGRPVVHIIGIEEERARDLAEDTGSFDHIAFIASDLPAMREHLAARKIEFRERKVPDLNITQLFVVDPNGVTIELNFPISA
jgi:catechol 2,3-dioxygenase-like lactoylglutathione lyase family enzyme